MNEPKQREQAAALARPVPTNAMVFMALSFVAVLLGCTVLATEPVWLGDSESLIGGLLIGQGTVGIAIASFFEATRSQRD